MNDLEKLQKQYNEVVKQNKSLQQELCDRNERITALEAEIELLKFEGYNIMTDKFLLIMLIGLLFLPIVVMEIQRRF